MRNFSFRPPWSGRVNRSGMANSRLGISAIAALALCVVILPIAFAVHRWPGIVLRARGLLQRSALLLPVLAPFGVTLAHGATGSATQVTVLAASQAVTTAAPGAVINIGTNFNVGAAVAASDTLAVFVVDSNGNTVGQFTNNLSNGLTILPTTEWLGPITITSSMTVPTVANGNYSIRVALEDGNGPVVLTAGAGVAVDSSYRYTIGTLTVNNCAPAPSFLPPATLNLSAYHLTFDDEFKTLSLSDSSTYDGSNWYTLNEQCCMQTSDGSGTAMVGLASPQNPYSLLAGGGLDIRLQKVSNNWTSGVLTSVDSKGKGFSQQYGYFEMRAQFPPGLDTWPAFWLLNTAAKSSNAPAGEIDITEYIANPGFANYQATTLHDWSNGTTPAMSHNEVPLPTSGFHNYGMMWTATTITFYFDGSVTFQTPTPSAMNQPYYLLVDLGIGAGWPTNNTPTPNDMLIQYVRAYSK